MLRMLTSLRPMRLTMVRITTIAIFIIVAASGVSDDLSDISYGDDYIGGLPQIYRQH